MLPVPCTKHFPPDRNADKIDHSLTLSKSLATGIVQGTKEILYKAAVEMVNPDCHGETHKRHLGFPARSAGKCALGRTGDLSRQAEVRASMSRAISAGS